METNRVIEPHTFDGVTYYPTVAGSAQTSKYFICGECDAYDNAKPNSLCRELNYVGNGCYTLAQPTEMRIIWLTQENLALFRLVGPNKFLTDDK